MRRIKAGVKELWAATKEVFSEFFADQPFQLAAALSYYTLLSLAPLLLLVIGLAGFVLGDEAVRGELVGQIGGLVGESGAELIQTLIVKTSTPTGGLFATLWGLGILLFGATTVFAQLQAALNQIWHVEASPDRAMVKTFVRARLLSLGLVIALGFLLLVSLVLSALIAALQGYLANLFPGATVLFMVVNLLVTLAAITLLIALMFKILPDIIIQWRDVVIGAAATGLLFTGGKYVIGLYLGEAAVGSAYGAAGSVIVLMVWVYYTSLILFFGAEITEVIARRRGATLKPAPHARLVRKTALPDGYAPWESQSKADHPSDNESSEQR